MHLNEEYEEYEDFKARVSTKYWSVLLIHQLTITRSQQTITNKIVHTFELSIIVWTNTMSIVIL